MPPLHSTTLLLSLVAIALSTGLLLLISSRQNRDETSLVYWGIANLIGAVGLVLLGLRGIASDWLSIDAANAVLMLGYALNWAGARRFCRLPVPWAWALAPAVIWLLLCQWPAFYTSVEWRVIASSAGLGLLTLACAVTFGNFKAEPLVSRYPAVTWFVIHACVFFVRIPFVMATSLPESDLVIGSYSVTLLLFEALFHLTVISFLQLSLTKDRAENRYRVAAETDVLTGAPNRRAFFDRAERALAMTVGAGRDGAVLVIDIDRFKQINDTFGHAGGDRVLVAVAGAIRGQLRPQDVYGRIGGEEFGCFIANVSASGAFQVAERLRSHIAGLTVPGDTVPISVSASIGVATIKGRKISLSHLLDEADTGLYTAKRGGRDRVEGGSRRASRGGARSARG